MDTTRVATEDSESRFSNRRRVPGGRAGRYISRLLPPGVKEKKEEKRKKERKPLEISRSRNSTFGDHPGGSVGGPIPLFFRMISQAIKLVGDRAAGEGRRLRRNLSRGMAVDNSKIYVRASEGIRGVGRPRWSKEKRRRREKKEGVGGGKKIALKPGDTPRERPEYTSPRDSYSRPNVASVRLL